LGEYSRRRSDSQAYARCKTDSEAMSSVQSTDRPPAGEVNDSPNGSYHMAGGVVPEWLKAPVSIIGVAVARFGRIDRSIGEPPCARRCRRTDARMIHLGSTEDSRLLDSVYKAFAPAKRQSAYGKLDVNRPEPPG
jgi:hypothetical protein